MSREYAPREHLHRNDRGREEQHSFFGGKPYVTPEAQWDAFIRTGIHTSRSNQSVSRSMDREVSNAGYRANVVQRAPAENFTNKSLKDHVDKGQKYMKTKSGQALDTHHMLDFRNQTLSAIAHIIAQAPNISKSRPLLRIPFKTQMRAGGARAEIGIDFDVNGLERGIKATSRPRSDEVQRLARDVMSMASYLVEYIQAGLPGGWGSAYQEEDLKSNYMGIEIGARGAKIKDQNPGISEREATTRAKDQVFKDAGVESSMKSYSTEKKDMDFRFKGGDKVYGDYTPGTAGITIRNWYVYGFPAGMKVGGRKVNREAMAYIRKLFFKLYHESLSKRKE